MEKICIKLISKKIKVIFLQYIICSTLEKNLDL